jgi:hypothetical protein
MLVIMTLHNTFIGYSFQNEEDCARYCVFASPKVGKKYQWLNNIGL